MNQRPSLREALKRADLIEIDELAEEIGQHAVAVALTEPERPPVPRIDEEERQRHLDAALADAIEVVSRNRMRLGRRVCSRPDATITRQVYELLRGMAGPDGGADNDPSFQ